MKIRESARAMRASGLPFAEIARRLDISGTHAYRLAGDVEPASQVQPTAGTVVRFFPHNGGSSMSSGMVPISLPRISALHGSYAGRASDSAGEMQNAA